MLEYEEFCFRAHLETPTLEAWMAAGWLVPAESEPRRRFSEADLARAHLIQDLHADLGVNDDGIDVILDLIDQIHGLRRSLKNLSSVLSLLPAETVEKIREQLKGRPA